MAALTLEVVCILLVKLMTGVRESGARGITTN